MRNAFVLRLAHARYELERELKVSAERGRIVLGALDAERPVHWHQETINRYVAD